jgi:cytochrome c oxidase subunit 2
VIRARAGAALTGLALAGCSGVQNPLDPVGRQASGITVVWDAMMLVCGVMYLLVLAFLAWALWRTRASPRLTEPVVAGTSADGPMGRGLIGWAALIVVGLTALILVSFVVDRGLAEAGPNPLRVKVTANQWWWEVEYQDPDASRQVTTANELHLPAGRPVRLELHANDVIHSFWAPNLAGKQDLIPGRTNYLNITPQRVGLFRAQCAEFCGLEHARMALDVTVESPDAFETWRNQQLQTAPEPVTWSQIEGKQVFLSKACVTCHAIAGTDAGGRNGPDLTHIASRRTIAAGTLPNTTGAMAAWIADPQGRKPGTAMPTVSLTSDELTNLVDYLESLK